MRRNPTKILLAFSLLIWASTAACVDTVELVVYGGGNQIIGGSEIFSRYGSNPTQTELESAASDMKAARITLHQHDTLQLTVMRTTGPGAPEDVTSSPKVMYSSVDPWLVSVNSTGLISVEPDPNFRASQELSDETPDLVKVTVLYGDGEGRVGSNVIFLNIVD